MDISDDTLSPDLPPPAAVVRRRGETTEQASYRKQGYSDEQTRYDSSGSTRRGGSVNPLERSYKIALAKEREARMAEGQDLHQANFERTQALNEKQFAAQERIHATAQKDKETALDQMGYMLDEQDQLAQQYGRGSREYMLGALSIAKKYPAAIMADPRLGQQLNHYDTVLTNAGVTQEVRQAISEIGQADATKPDMVGYLDSIPGKYPGIVNDPHVMGLFNTKRKEAAAAQLQRENPQLQPDRATIETPGGNLTLTNPKAEKDLLMPVLERERKLYATEFSKARARRQSAEGKGDDITAAADADVKDYEAKLADIESQIRSHRDSAPKALDADGAKALLSEAGGDKAKARQLAKDRGFHF